MKRFQPLQTIKSLVKLFDNLWCILYIILFHKVCPCVSVYQCDCLLANSSQTTKWIDVIFCKNIKGGCEKVLDQFEAPVVPHVRRRRERTAEGSCFELLKAVCAP